MPSSRPRVPLNPVTLGKRVVVTTTRPLGPRWALPSTPERRSSAARWTAYSTARRSTGSSSPARQRAPPDRGTSRARQRRRIATRRQPVRQWTDRPLAQRLGESEALWGLIDEIAQSPAVLAAVSQQGRRFADQVGDEMRTRSRRADDWLERAARRLAHRQQDALPPADPDATSDGLPPSHLRWACHRSHLRWASHSSLLTRGLRLTATALVRRARDEGVLVCDRCRDHQRGGDLRRGRRGARPIPVASAVACQDGDRCARRRRVHPLEILSATSSRSGPGRTDAGGPRAPDPRRDGCRRQAV